MSERKVVIFFKRFSKELTIALMLAVVAAVALEWWNNWSQQQAIQNDLKAVATIEALNNKGRSIGQGSGFFINSTGLLATNYHVINGASDIIAKLPSGAFYALQSVKHIDQNVDIAIELISKRRFYAQNLNKNRPKATFEMTSFYNSMQERRHL